MSYFSKSDQQNSRESISSDSLNKNSQSNDSINSIASDFHGPGYSDMEYTLFNKSVLELEGAPDNASEEAPELRRSRRKKPEITLYACDKHGSNELLNDSCTSLQSLDTFTSSDRQSTSERLQDFVEDVSEESILVKCMQKVLDTTNIPLIVAKAGEHIAITDTQQFIKSMKIVLNREQFSEYKYFSDLFKALQCVEIDRKIFSNFNDDEMSIVADKISGTMSDGSKALLFRYMSMVNNMQLRAQTSNVLDTESANALLSMDEHVSLLSASISLQTAICAFIKKIGSKAFYDLFGIEKTMEFVLDKDTGSFFTGIIPSSQENKVPNFNDEAKLCSESEKKTHEELQQTSVVESKEDEISDNKESEVSDNELSQSDDKSKDNTSNTQSNSYCVIQ